MSSNYPNMLYHYTSIENLALILKNRTIRLNALDRMDDRQEQKSYEGLAFGKLVFVSSWTAEITESIPMWKMYTSPNAGVRIGLPPMPFTKHGTANPAFSRAFAPVGEGGEYAEMIAGDTFLDIEKLCKSDLYSFEAYTGDILHEVIYTSDKNLLEPQIHTQGEKKHNFNFPLLGRHKNTHWSFQKEWRYRMCFWRAKYDLSTMSFSVASESEVQSYSSGGLNPPFSYYDLDIDSASYNQMIITPSPQISAGNRILLESLVEKYNPSALIKESSLLGLI